MKGKFLGNIGFLILLNILIKGGWILGIDRVVQNTVGASVYGNYYALLNFTFLFSILIDLGITNYNNRRIAQDRSLLSQHLPGILGTKLILSILYLSVVLITGLILGYDREQFFFIPILAFNQILLSFILYIRSNLGGLHLFRTDSVISVLDRGLMILFCSILLWGMPAEVSFRIEWFVLAQTAAYTITACSGLFILLRRSGRIAPRWDPSFLFRILKESFPYALLILLMTFYNRVDSVMLERMLPDGNTQAGIYAQGFRILDAVSQLGYLFATMLLPLFARAIEKKDHHGIREVLDSSTRLLVPGAALVAIVCCFHALPIMELLYREEHHRAAPVFSVLMISFIPVAGSYIYGTLLTAEGAMKKMNLLAGGGMLLNILLNALLIPAYGALGSGIATLITQGGAALAQTGTALGHYPMKWGKQRILSGIGFLLFLIASGYLLQEGTSFSPLISLFIHAIAGLAGLFAFRLFRLREALELLRGIGGDHRNR
jgi:O-antigen/teichoic acid export membrane protein